jgi:two-component system response regulator NreC
MSKNSKISVIICDDHPIFRQGLIRIIERDESLILVGECGDGNAALDLIKNQKPQIAILDITMPGKTGLAIAHLVKKEQLVTKLIILTMHEDEEYLKEAIDIGVQGYLLKENAVTDLTICIQKVASGQYYVSPLLEDVLAGYSQKTISKNTYISELEKLTDMEKKVLKLIANNKTSEEITKELNVHYDDVQNNRQQIIDKLDLYGPYKLFQFALKHKDSF